MKGRACTKALKKTTATFDRLIAAAKKKNADRDEIEELRSEAQSEYMVAECARRDAIVELIRREAFDFYLAMPNQKNDEMWEDHYYSHLGAPKTLSDTGISFMFSEIRK